MYYHLNMKLLHLYKNSCPEIQLPVSLLTTRVRAPHQHNWKKLGKTLQYLDLTKDLPLTLEASSVQVIFFFVDASFSVYGDMRSHTGVFMNTRKGCVYGTSVRHNLNTKILTEADMVGFSDLLPQAIWARYFLEAQGYKNEDL